MIELHETEGRPFACPTCGKPAQIIPDPYWRQPGRKQPITAAFWVLTECSGVCGRVSRKRDQRVALVPAAEPTEARP